MIFNLSEDLIQPSTCVEAIVSERLHLVRMTPAFLRASLQGRLEDAGRELNRTLPPGWPGDVADVLSLRLAQLEARPELQPWLLRAMVLRESNVMIGHIGFHTAPGAAYLEPYSPGAVEFGFTVYPPFHRQGYAREASLAMMDWAHRVHGVTRFILCISPSNLPSQSLAAQLGFVQIGSHLDEVDGPEDVLEYRLTH
jgi:RimJ/RimL family protein N-acetyltransferase